MEIKSPGSGVYQLGLNTSYAVCQTLGCDSSFDLQSPRLYNKDANKSIMHTLCRETHKGGKMYLH